MTDSILTLRLTRRAIGAAAIRNGEMVLLDGRFLNSRTERTVPSALRYVDKLLTLTHPTLVVIDAPGEHESTLTGQLRRALDAMLTARGISLLTLDRRDLLAAFGVTRLQDRREIRELLRILWADVERFRGKTQPFVADAAAGALYAEAEVALGLRSP